MVFGADGEDEAIGGKIIPAISKEYYPKVAPYLRAARATIDVVMYLWGWYGYRPSALVQRLNYEYLAAARRGVRVRVLLNADRCGGNLSRINSQAATELRRAGVDVKMDTTGQLTHAKVVIIDDEVVVLGSHNYSERSMATNNETSVIISDKSVASRYKWIFKQLFERV